MAVVHRRGKGRTRKSVSPERISSYKHQFDRTKKNKDRNVQRSSHGVFKSVAELETHRIKIEEKKS